MKKFILLTVSILSLSLLFSSCGKDKERVVIEEEKIYGTWTGDYQSVGFLTMKFTSGAKFSGMISVKDGDKLIDYETFEGSYNLYGNKLVLYVTKLAQKNDSGGWDSLPNYSETINVTLTFKDDNNVTAKWGKSGTVDLVRK